MLHGGLSRGDSHTDNAIIPLKERVVDEFYDPLTMLFRKVRGRSTAFWLCRASSVSLPGKNSLIVRFDQRATKQEVLWNTN